jgi:hypothetical protein
MCIGLNSEIFCSLEEDIPHIIYYCFVTRSEKLFSLIGDSRIPRIRKCNNRICLCFLYNFRSPFLTEDTMHLVTSHLATFHLIMLNSLERLHAILCIDFSSRLGENFQGRFESFLSTVLAPPLVIFSCTFLTSISPS